MKEEPDLLELARRATEELKAGLWPMSPAMDAFSVAATPSRIIRELEEKEALQTAYDEAITTIEGLGRLGELVTAFVDPSGVLDVTGLKNRIVAAEAACSRLREALERLNAAVDAYWNADPRSREPETKALCEAQVNSFQALQSTEAVP